MMMAGRQEGRRNDFVWLLWRVLTDIFGFYPSCVIYIAEPIRGDDWILLHRLPGGDWSAPTINRTRTNSELLINYFTEYQGFQRIFSYLQLSYDNFEWNPFNLPIATISSRSWSKTVRNPGGFSFENWQNFLNWFKSFDSHKRNQSEFEFKISNSKTSINTRHSLKTDMYID